VSFASPLESASGAQDAAIESQPAPSPWALCPGSLATLAPALDRDPRDKPEGDNALLKAVDRSVPAAAHSHVMTRNDLLNPEMRTDILPSIFNHIRAIGTVLGR